MRKGAGPDALRDSRDPCNNPTREVSSLAILLRPATLAHIKALIAGNDIFAAQFGLRVIPGYLAFPEALEYTLKSLAEGLDPTWSSHLIIDPEAGELVGLGGVNGVPAH